MPRMKPLCEVYEKGRTRFSNSLDAGRYLAAVERATLPRRSNTDNHITRLGFAVGFGQWFFFDDFEPAIAFGRAARMSIDCLGYGVYAAAHETMHCLRHGDERVLHLTGPSLDRVDGEAEVLRRFADGVARSPGSAHWNPPPRPRKWA